MVGRVKVDRINILVLFRRVLRVLDRTIRTMAEPIRMFTHPWMIRRTLHGEINRRLEPEVFRGRNEMLEIMRGAKVGIDRFVPARTVADRPRASRAGVSAIELLARTLAVSDAYRMHRRKIDNIEPHIADARKTSFRLA